jgi:hypothetical protein
MTLLVGNPPLLAWRLLATERMRHGDQRAGLVRHNRHQPLWDLTRMSYAVLRAMMRRMDIPQRAPAAGDIPGIWPLGAPEAYLHAVATDAGLRLDAHYEELTERPPMAEVLAAEQDRDTVA